MTKKIIIISGGTEGLGKSIAKILSELYQVIILSPTEIKLKKTSKQIDCDLRLCDISNWENVAQSIQSIFNQYNKIDCLINNASLYIEKELELNDPKYIKRVNDVNITGTEFLTKAVIPIMKKQKNGLIINIDSQAGLIGQNGKSIYNASKGAIHIFTKCLQIELSKYNIQVTGIYPGKINTKMFKNMGIKKGMSNAIDPKYIAETIKFILSFNNQVVFSEIGIKNPKN